MAVVLGSLLAPAASMAANDFHTPTPLPFNQATLADSRTADIQAGEPITDLFAGGDFCPGPGTAPDVSANKTEWFQFFGTGGAVRLTTGGSLTFEPRTFDTVLGVWRGPTLAGADFVDCNDDDQANDSVTSGLTLPTTVAGASYLVQVGACDGSPGTAPATTLCTNATSQDGIYSVAAITNDDPSGAVLLSSGSASGLNNGTTTAPGENLSCNGTSYSKTVWYSWDSPGTGTASVSVAGGLDAPVVAVYRDGALAGCATGGAGGATASVPVTAGRYQIQVAGQGGADGDFGITARFGAAPPPAANPDRDRDGALNGADCAPDNPAIHPGAIDVPGDKVDQDCSGRDARFSINPARPRANWTFFRHFTRLTRLVAVNVRANSRIEVRCSGRSCPFKRPQVKRVRKARARVSLLGRKLRRAHLRPKTTIEVRISTPGFITRVTRLRFNRLRHDPVQQTRCIAPGTKRVTRCG